MRVSAKSDYALRATIAIAREHPSFVKAAQISAAEGIPLEYLQNILNDLRRAAVLVAQRGYDGGYRLAREPRLVAVQDVLLAIGSALAEPHEAPDGSPWHVIDRAIGTVLGRTTIARLVRLSR